MHLYIILDENSMRMRIQRTPRKGKQLGREMDAVRARESLGPKKEAGPNGAALRAPGLARRTRYRTLSPHASELRPGAKNAVF